MPYTKFPGACPEDRRKARRIYPDGIPLTLTAARKLMAAGVDVMWGLISLLDKRDRPDFMLFTLRQRQPHLVTLLTKAGLDEHAQNVAALKFNTQAQARDAIPALNASAWAASARASWASAWTASARASWAASKAASRDASLVASRVASLAAAARDEQARWCLRRIQQRENGA